MLDFLYFKINASLILLLIALIGLFIAAYFSNKEAMKKD